MDEGARLFLILFLFVIGGIMGWVGMDIIEWWERRKNKDD